MTPTEAARAAAPSPSSPRTRFCSCGRPIALHSRYTVCGWCLSPSDAQVLQQPRHEPSPEEIALACQHLQEQWSQHDRIRRAGANHSDHASIIQHIEDRHRAAESKSQY